jgi:alpha-beta hydrolase superfamily lysophospholipase
MNKKVAPALHSCWRIGALMAGIIAVMVGLCAGLAWTEASYASDTQFYAYAPDQASGPPGSIIRIETMSGAPLGASAYRVLYRSTGLHGESIAVSGVIVVPAGVAADGSRAIVAWAHPTTGVVSRCAPSEAFFVFQTIIGLREMIRRGYIVAATDYPGLGTEGPHPYLVGSSEAHAVIDAVRAARQIAGAQASDRYVVWGHSQGGQAALFAGMLAGSYAPELHLMGVAAAAPATDLDRLLREDADTDGGRNVTAMTLWSWHRVYGLPISEVVEPAAMPAVDALSNECIESLYDVFQRRYSQRPLRKQFLADADVTQQEPWHSLVTENSPGTLPPDIPVLLTQGSADQLVLPQITRAYARRLCDAGSRLEYLELAGVGHGFIAADSASHVVDWITDRFDHKRPPDDCPALMQTGQGEPSG